MKHLTEKIPASLAQRLKSTTLADDIWENYRRHTGSLSFAEIFDWLLDRGVHIRIESDWDTETQIVTKLACGFRIEKVGMRPIYVDIQDWHNAATLAIEKALTLIS